MTIPSEQSRELLKVWFVFGNSFVAGLIRLLFLMAGCVIRDKGRRRMLSEWTLITIDAIMSP